MNTAQVKGVRYGVTFGASLALSWLAITPLLGWVFWSGPHTTDALAMWIALWIFAIAVPTLQAVVVHRRLNEALDACPTLVPRVRRDLAHTRFVLLMCGSMTVLTVVALRFSGR